MGKAVERGVFDALATTQGPDFAAQQALMAFDGLMSGEVCEERDAVGPIAAGMMQLLIPFGSPIKTDEPRKRVVRVDGLSHEISYETDIIFERGIVDLKATMRMPSEPRTSHVRQVGLYSRFLGMPAFLCYATPKKSGTFELSQGQLGSGYDDLFQAFKQIERCDRIWPTPEDAMRHIPLDTSSFYFDEDDKPIARRLWAEANEES